MKKVILVAHGNGDNGTFSIPKVKTITKAKEGLSFEKAREYMAETKSWPEYASTNFDEFGMLSDADCHKLFDLVPTGNGIVSTGLHRGGDLGGPLIYALRGLDIDSADITTFIDQNDVTSMVLLACRD